MYFPPRTAAYVAFDPFRPRHTRYARRPNIDVEQARPVSPFPPSLRAGHDRFPTTSGLALAGEFVPSGATPAPTRGWNHVDGDINKSWESWGGVPALVIAESDTQASFVVTEESPQSSPYLSPNLLSSHHSDDLSTGEVTPPMSIDPAVLRPAWRTVQSPPRRSRLRRLTSHLSRDEAVSLDAGDPRRPEDGTTSRSRSRSPSVHSLARRSPFQTENHVKHDATALSSTHSHSHRPDIPSNRPEVNSEDNLDASRTKYFLVFIFESVPQQIYLHLLLRLPSLYFSRVARVFEDAELSLSDIEKMAVTRMDEWHSKPKMNERIPSHALWDHDQEVSPALKQFKSSWEDFVDSLINEWKVLNVISALLSS